MTFDGTSGFFTDEDEEDGENFIEPTDRPHKRYLLPDATGSIVPFTKVTTISGTLGNKFGIERNQAQRLLDGLIARPDLFHAACAQYQDTAALKEIMSQALIIGGAGKEAIAGQALHAVIQRYFKGETIDELPEVFHPQLRAMELELKRKRLRIVPETVERVVRHPHYEGIAGRIDGIAYEEDLGTYVVIDTKNERQPKEHPHHIATQLGIYTNCDAMFNYATNQYEPLPSPLRKDYALVMWFDPSNPDSCEIFRVDTNLGYWSVRLALDLRTWQSIKTLVHPYITNGDWVPKEGTQQRVELAEETIAELLEQPDTPVPVVEAEKPTESSKIAAKISEAKLRGETLAQLLEVPFGKRDAVAEAMDLAEGSKSDLVAMIQQLGSDDIKHHRKDLAEILVRLLNDRRRGNKPASKAVPKPTPEPEPTVEPAPAATTYTIEMALAHIAAAESKEDLQEVWERYTAEHGADSWKGELNLKGMKRFAEIKAQESKPKASSPFD